MATKKKTPLVATKELLKNAFSLGNGKVDYYLTVMSADEIFECSKVSRVDENPTEGYQRLLSTRRAEDIADYLNNGNIIPGAIILSAQKNANLDFNQDTQQLKIAMVPNSLFVIDGQHRLYGSKLADKDIQLPVCILNGLAHEEEVTYFIDINSTQKGVPKTLRLELLKFLSEPDSLDAIRHKLFKDLNQDIESPLYDRMSSTSSAPGRLSLVPFKSAIDPLINGDTLASFSYDMKYKIIRNYLNAVAVVLERSEENSKRLSTSAFFQAIFKIFEKCSNLAIIYHKNYQQESYLEILKGIENIDFEKHSGSNQAAINSLASELSTLIDINSKKLPSPIDLA